MSCVNLGIIGTGIAAENLHWPALENLTDRFRITVVSNHTEPKAKAFSERVGGVPYVLDYREVLSRDDVDAVSILLPIEWNYKVTRAALEAGKHVMVEKPLAVNMAEAAEMLKLDQQYPLVKMVAENFRYIKLREKLLTYLDDGKIGEPRIVTWDIYHHVNPEENRYAQTKWRINHQYAGGFITDGGVHNMALLRDVFGDITDGHAWTDSLNPSVGKMDSFSFRFKTQQGIKGSFNLFVSTNGIDENRLSVLGTKGSLSVKDNVIRLFTKGDSTVLDTLEYDGGYVAEYEDFYRAITENRPVRATFAESYRDLEVLLDAIGNAE